MNVPVWTDSVRITRVVICEWLPGEKPEDRTGTILAKSIREDMRHLFEVRECATRADVLRSLAEITDEIPSKGVPILQLEAHGRFGAQGGLGAGEEFIGWSELRSPLAGLNVATGFNLALASVACHGLSALFSVGETLSPAPFIACLGFVGDAFPAAIVKALREFYTGTIRGGVTMEESAAQAQREIANTPTRVDFQNLRSLITQTLRDIRNGDWRKGVDTYGLEAAQLVVSSLLAYDLFPENRARFGIDVRAILLGS